MGGPTQRITHLVLHDTSVAAQGLFIRTFEEIKSTENPKFPEFYTLIADKTDIQLPPLYA
jgi:hypothetical protein